jgi:hypothetical protein
MARPQSSLPTIELRERGGPDEQGEPRFLDNRRFFQLLVFDAPSSALSAKAATDLLAALQGTSVAGVVYTDVNNPEGIGLLTTTTSPEEFVTVVRPLLAAPELADLSVRHGWSMLGRTYAVGYEQNLQHWLIDRPLANVQDDQYAWHVWYPLRRKGEFNRLEARDQRRILGEHGTIGRAYGQTGHATDVRLACHGLDADDNDFVIGLIGDGLHVLSHLVQRMRATEQTGEWMQEMGPFFVGHVVGRHGG